MCWRSSFGDFASISLIFLKCFSPEMSIAFSSCAVAADIASASGMLLFLVYLNLYCTPFSAILSVTGVLFRLILMYFRTVFANSMFMYLARM